MAVNTDDWALKDVGARRKVVGQSGEKHHVSEVSNSFLHSYILEKPLLQRTSLKVLLSKVPSEEILKSKQLANFLVLAGSLWGLIQACKPRQG